RKLMEVSMRLYASADYLAEMGTPDRLEDLNQHRLVSFTEDAQQPSEAAGWIQKRLSPYRNAHLSMNSYFGVLKAATAGLGIAALPDYVTRDTSELVNVLPDEQSPSFSVYFTYPEELRRSQRVVAFRDFMIAEVEAFTRGPSATGSVAEIV
ncbi:MAG: LysR substrate-binding domain-containing protein, partial [Pseudomonadota bacterium]